MEISEILMNVMSCHGFSKDQLWTVILTCLSTLVPYHLSKGSVVLEIEEDGLDNVPGGVKNKINDVDLYDE